MTYYAQNRLRHIDLGVCCLVLVDKHAHQYDHIDKHCKVLADSWISHTTWSQRVVDVGFAGSWLYLDRYMVDYDVNDDEWPDEEKT